MIFAAGTASWLGRTDDALRCLAKAKDEHDDPLSAQLWQLATSPSHPRQRAYEQAGETSPELLPRFSNLHGREAGAWLVHRRQCEANLAIGRLGGCHSHGNVPSEVSTAPLVDRHKSVARCVNAKRPTESLRFLAASLGPRLSDARRRPTESTFLECTSANAGTLKRDFANAADS